MRVDGEVPYLVLEVLPALAAGVWVHVHDVHFPYNTPVDPAGYVFNRATPALDPTTGEAQLDPATGREILISYKELGTQLIERRLVDMLLDLGAGRKAGGPQIEVCAQFAREVVEAGAAVVDGCGVEVTAFCREVCLGCG